MTKEIKPKILKNKKELRSLPLGEVVLLPESNIEVLVVYAGVIENCHGGFSWEFIKPNRRNPDNISSYRISFEARVIPGHERLVLESDSGQFIEYSLSDEGYSEKRRMLEEK